MLVASDLVTADQAAGILGLTHQGFNRRVRHGEVPIFFEFPGSRGPKLFRRADIEAGR